MVYSEEILNAALAIYYLFFSAIVVVYYNKFIVDSYGHTTFYWSCIVISFSLTLNHVSLLFEKNVLVSGILVTIARGFLFFIVSLWSNKIAHIKNERDEIKNIKRHIVPIIFGLLEAYTYTLRLYQGITIGNCTVGGVLVISMFIYALNKRVTKIDQAKRYGKYENHIDDSEIIDEEPDISTTKKPKKQPQLLELILIYGLLFVYTFIIDIESLITQSQKNTPVQNLYRSLANSWGIPSIIIILCSYLDIHF